MVEQSHGEIASPQPTPPVSPPVGSTQDHQEIELQFTAPDLPAVGRWIRRNHRRFGLQLLPAVSLDLQDTYYDTPDWRLHRAGYKFRARQTQQHIELTFKSLSDTPPGAVKNRHELTQIIDRSPSDPLAAASDRVAHWLRALASRTPPRPLFTLHTHRTLHTLVRQEQPVAQIAIDATRITQAGDSDPAAFQWVELEGEAVGDHEFQPFLNALARACHLTPTNHSKFAAGLQLNHLTPPARPGFEPLAPSPTLNLASFACGSLRREFIELLQREPGTRLGEDPEELHQMRVATRRLRAGLRFFKPHLPPSLQRSRGTLQWLGKTLGAVRDLDVKISELQQWRATLTSAHQAETDPILVWLARDRTRARKELIRALDSRRYLQFQTRLHQSLAMPGTAKRSSPLPAHPTLPDLIRPLYRKVINAGRSALAQPLPQHCHRFRIRCKRLRYALEFVSHLRAKGLKQHRKLLTRLQDLLGRYNDTVVARNDLHNWLQGSAGPLPPRTAFLLGTLEERLRARADSCLRQLPKQFRAFKQLRWRPLKKALHHGTRHPPQGADV